MSRAFAIPRPDTAFALSGSTRKKHPRVKDDNYLDFIRGLPSCLSGERPVDACHIRYGDHAYGKRETGMSERADDVWTLPLTRAEHMAQHAMSEREFWARHGIDPLALCTKLFACNQDYERAELVIADAIRTASTFLGRRTDMETGQ